MEAPANLRHPISLAIIVFLLWFKNSYLKWKYLSYVWEIKSDLCNRLNLGLPNKIKDTQLIWTYDKQWLFFFFLVYLQVFIVYLKFIWLLCFYLWKVASLMFPQSTVFGYLSELYKGTEEFHTECRDIIFFASFHSSCCLLLQVETQAFIDSPSIHQNTGYIAAKHFCWEISQKEISLMTLPSASLDCCYVHTRGEEDVGNGIVRSLL